MLNKDEYNQDEYNDYYAQEVRGAEISGEEDEGSGKKIAVIFLLLLLIMAVGYFGWKSMNTSASNENRITVSKIDETKDVKKVEENQNIPIKSTQAEVITEQVINIASSTNAKADMNREEIATLIRTVMMKMNKEKADESTTSSTSTSDNSEVPEEDNKLMASLTDADVDSLSTISEGDEQKKPELSKDVDIYNKVVLKEGASDSTDALSQLSDNMSNITDTEDESAPEVDNSYTASITKEVETRKQEMRYYIVKKGDTLGKVAKRFYGNVMDYEKIYEANPDILRRPDKIYIGQKLRIP